MTNRRLRASSSELIKDEECRRASATIEMVGRRWNSGILLALGRGATRFGEMLGMVEGLSDRMLSVRLKELEHAGLVTRAVEPTMPVSVRYGLSPRGRELLAALHPLALYGHRWEDTEPNATQSVESDRRERRAKAR